MRQEIICGDCLEELPKIADKSIDLTVTSPPYDNLRAYKGYSFNFEGLAKELYRVTKDGGVLVWVVNDATINGSETLTSFKQAIYFKERVGFNIHDTMIYAKNNYVPLTHNRYEQQFEFMFVFSKGKPATFNPLMIPSKTAGSLRNDAYVCGATVEKGAAIRSGIEGKIRKVKDEKIKPNIWFYDIGKNQTTHDDIAFQHPAIFPEALVRDHILSWSNEGDLIPDPFAGSGTTLKVAKQLNRNFIGIEISPEYVEIAKKRLANIQSVLVP